MLPDNLILRLESLEQAKTLAQVFGQVVGAVVQNDDRPVTISVYAGPDTGKTTFIRYSFPFIPLDPDYRGWAYRLGQIDIGGQLHRHFDCAPPCDQSFGWKSDEPRPAGKAGLEIYEHAHKEMLVNSDIVVVLAQPNGIALDYLHRIQGLVKKHCTRPYVHVYAPDSLPLYLQLFRKARGLCQSNKEAQIVGKKLLPFLKKTAFVTEKELLKTKSPKESNLRLLSVFPLSEDHRVNQAVQRFNEIARSHASLAS